MSQLNDPASVASEYASESGLVARASVYQGLAGPDARELAFQAVRECAPNRVLEVGCGWGEFAARVRDELGAEVMALDISPRMVELARERGLDAQLGDVQDLHFPDAGFDCVIANWMLYHVPDLDAGLAEIARVLRPGGRLVAATNGKGHLGELWSLVGRDKWEEPREFIAETGEDELKRHFAHVERRDLESTMTFADAESVRGYISSSIAYKHLAERVPSVMEPLVATRRNAIFVAETVA